MSNVSFWDRFLSWNLEFEQVGFALDLSKMNFSDSFVAEMSGKIERAFSDMRLLESGGISNPDENRMVGHYWLRSPDLAPTADLASQIKDMLVRVKEFSSAVHTGQICTTGGTRFKHLLVIGIGGSALGPQFVNQALSTALDPLDIYFFDNTDPDGFIRVLQNIPNLSETLCVVISKSGGTKETRNGQLIAQEAFKQAGVDYSKHFVAITCIGSALDQIAEEEKWLARFPMWDWVGGRTSELSAVGLLPAALQGFDIDMILRGAADMDQLTRSEELKHNPAMMLALMWYYAGGGSGQRDMVVLPYKDRLELFSRYLQQLVMESLGKEHDINGVCVHQGLTVYGNKGSTDQHAFVQQLRDGQNSFFVVFVEVLRDMAVRSGKETVSNSWASRYQVEDRVTCGDYLAGFYLGTRQALAEAGRESITITIRELNAHSVGMLIALFERAVGFYASFININAYHQPGVEAGKRAANSVLVLQSKLLGILGNCNAAISFSELITRASAESQKELVYKIIKRLEATGRIIGSEPGFSELKTYSLAPRTS